MMSNGVKFIDQGGVTLRLHANLMVDSGHLLLSFEVSDTGVAIAPHDRARISEPFVQVGTPTFQKGTGLGLSITREFVQTLGGTIGVESTPGKGTPFRVELPVEQADAAEVTGGKGNSEPIIALAPGQPEYRTHIVDDEKDNWLLLERPLDQVGFRVQEAEDGLQAVERFRRWRPHLIWMDLRLPVMSGLDATRRIRGLEGGSDVKIIALTASAFTSEREEVLAADMDDLLRKACRRTEIFDRMARRLEVRYVYGRAPTGEDEAMELRQGALAALPNGLRNELATALISLDAERIATVIHHVSELDATLGACKRLKRKVSSTEEIE
jgi:CheY-like chemotaxis protein